MSLYLRRHIPMLLASGLFLSACSDKPATPAADTQVASAGAETQKPAISTANTEENGPLDSKDVKFLITLVGHPKYVEDQDVLMFTVDVANHGRVPLVGKGANPVNLAALLLGPDGPDKAPGLREFVRVHLPLIAPGEQRPVQVVLPAKALKGQTVQFFLVQEGVAWFSGPGQSPLTLGAYSRCNGMANTLCDATGAAVSKE
jgi:hypothetical protein